MFKKIKRIIPNLTEKLKKNNIEDKHQEDVESDYPVVEFRHLSNGPEYRNANLILKVWYLRGKMDWFDNVLMSSSVTADSMSELLTEIMEELDRIAYSRKTMNDTCAFLNLKHNVLGYYMQYRGELNHDTDYYDVPVDETSSIYEQIWCLRYMFDCACVADSKEIFSDVCGWLKSMLTSVDGKEAEAIKKLLKQVKEEKHKCFFRNLRS